MEWQKVTAGYRAALSFVIIPTGGFVGALVQIFRDPERIDTNIVTLFVVMMFAPAGGRILDVVLHRGSGKSSTETQDSSQD